MEFKEIIASMGHALTRGDLFGRFYEIFLQSHPKIKGMFAERRYWLIGDESFT